MFPTAYGQIRLMVNSECSRFPYFGGTDVFLRSNLQFWIYELGGGGLLAFWNCPGLAGFM